MKETGYRPEIDGLRALAVLCVMLYHFGWPLPGGFLGVDIFFVISGYLITKLIQDEIDTTGTVRFGHFYLRRARRLFPALGVVLAGTSICAALIMSQANLVAFGKELASATFSYSNVLFYMQTGYFETNALLRPLLHTWSLAVEEQFYLVWPAAVLLVFHWAPSIRWPLLLIGAVASLLAAEFISDRDAAFYLPWFRFFEFAAGAALVRLNEFGRPGNGTQSLLLLIGLAAMLLPIFVYGRYAAPRFPHAGFR